jgi:hypothetical protein
MKANAPNALSPTIATPSLFNALSGQHINQPQQPRRHIPPKPPNLFLSTTIIGSIYMTSTHRYFVTTALSAKQRKIPKKSAKPTPKKNITIKHNKALILHIFIFHP